MDLRQMLRYARSHGWDHVIYGLGTGREHVWRSPDWRVSAERLGGQVWEICVDNRWRDAEGHVYDSPVVKLYATSVKQAWAVLVALGVLPVMEEVPTA